MTKEVGGCQYQLAYPLAYNGEQCQTFSVNRRTQSSHFSADHKAVHAIRSKGVMM